MNTNDSRCLLIQEKAKSQMASSCMAQAHHTGKNPKLREKPVLRWTHGEAGETNQGGSNNHRGRKTGGETRQKNNNKTKQNTSIQNKTGNHKKDKIKNLIPTIALNGLVCLLCFILENIDSTKLLNTVNCVISIFFIL